MNCPECNKEVSDKASSCPYCGCPIQPDATPQEVKVVQAPNKEGCFLQTMNVGCMIVAAVIIFIIIVALFQ
jgi:hypothetical protein